MRVLKWIACWFLSYGLIVAFCTIFTGGAYIIFTPILAPIVATIIYRATTAPKIIDYENE